VFIADAIEVAATKRPDARRRRKPKVWNRGYTMKSPSVSRAADSSKSTNAGLNIPFRRESA
jgi:hypothetical protein